MIKVCSCKLLMIVFVYYYVILEQSVFIFFRSQANDNCLFSTFSIVMCGDNRYVNDLRILAATQFYLKSSFYSEHRPVLQIQYQLHRFRTMHTSFKQAGFLCVLGLTSVCSSSVQYYYKSTGSLIKYKLMFSPLFRPCLFNPFNNEKNDLLLCNNTSEPPVF